VIIADIIKLALYHAEQHFNVGSKELAIALLNAAEEDLDSDSVSAVEFLELNQNIDRLIRTYIVNQI